MQAQAADIPIVIRPHLLMAEEMKALHRVEIAIAHRSREVAVKVITRAEVEVCQKCLKAENAMQLLSGVAAHYVSCPPRLLEKDDFLPA
ncbi:unnamed protein product, partial [Strongylus vulgaris]